MKRGRKQGQLNPNSKASQLARLAIGESMYWEKGNPSSGRGRDAEAQSYAVRLGMTIQTKTFLCVSPIDEEVIRIVRITRTA